MIMQDDSTLRSLDVAAESLTADEQERAKATLERIVATEPTTAAPRPAAPAPARRGWRRFVVISAAAGAIAFALIVGSFVVQGIGGDKAAYAS